MHRDTSCCLRDEEAAGSNPATPTGKRQITRYLAACRLHYPFPDVRFWEPVGSEQGNGGQAAGAVTEGRSADKAVRAGTSPFG